MTDFLCQIEILLLNMLKLLKNSRFFSLNCQITGFSRFFGNLDVYKKRLVKKV